MRTVLLVPAFTLLGLICAEAHADPLCVPGGPCFNTLREKDRYLNGVQGHETIKRRSGSKQSSDGTLEAWENYRKQREKVKARRAAAEYQKRVQLCLRFLFLLHDDARSSRKYNSRPTPNGWSGSRPMCASLEPVYSRCLAHARNPKMPPGTEACLRTTDFTKQQYAAIMNTKTGRGSAKARAANAFLKADRKRRDNRQRAGLKKGLSHQLRRCEAGDPGYCDFARDAVERICAGTSKCQERDLLRTAEAKSRKTIGSTKGKDQFQIRYEAKKRLCRGGDHIACGTVVFGPGYGMGKKERLELAVLGCQLHRKKYPNKPDAKSSLCVYANNITLYASESCRQAFWRGGAGMKCYVAAQSASNREQRLSFAKSACRLRFAKREEKFRLEMCALAKMDPATKPKVTKSTFRGRKPDGPYWTKTAWIQKNRRLPITPEERAEAKAAKKRERDRIDALKKEAERLPNHVGLDLRACLGQRRSHRCAKFIRNPDVIARKEWKLVAAKIGCNTALSSKNYVDVRRRWLCDFAKTPAKFSARDCETQKKSKNRGAALCGVASLYAKNKSKKMEYMALFCALNGKGEPARDQACKDHDKTASKAPPKSAPPGPPPMTAQDVLAKVNKLYAGCRPPERRTSKCFAVARFLDDRVPRKMRIDAAKQGCSQQGGKNHWMCDFKRRPFAHAKGRCNERVKGGTIGEPMCAIASFLAPNEKQRTEFRTKYCRRRPSHTPLSLRICKKPSK